MLGQGVGELVAACIAGVFSLEDGLAIVAERGRLMAETPAAPPAHAAFLERLRRVRLAAPRIPFVAGLTGGWIRPEEATDPAYWGRHLRESVRFSAGIATLLAEPDRVLLEVGPGRALAALAAPQAAGRPVLSSLGNPAEEGSDAFHLTAAVGRLWIEGHQLDPARLFAGQERRRVSLPAYSFERLRYWIEPDRAQPAPEATAEVAATAVLTAAPDVAMRPSAGVARMAAQTLHPRPRLATPFVAPRGEMEERIAELWRRVLGVAEIGIYDSFLDLGGHSLLATQMLSSLREEMQVDLPIEEMFADPTVAGVAAAAVEAQAAASSPDELAALLAEIQGMSDSELEAELAGARDGRDDGREERGLA